MKLQDAYISESSVAFGTWKTIGYTMKTTTVFHYYEGAKGTSEGGSGNAVTTALPASPEDVWSASPVASLNECSTDDSWTISVSAAGDNNGAQYDVTVSSENCDILAPSMGKLDHDGTATVN